MAPEVRKDNERTFSQRAQLERKRAAVASFREGPDVQRAGMQHRALDLQQWKVLSPPRADGGAEDQGSEDSLIAAHPHRRWRNSCGRPLGGTHDGAIHRLEEATMRHGQEP